MDCHEPLLTSTALNFPATKPDNDRLATSQPGGWRVRGRPHYGPELGLRIYGDDWRWRRGENYRWRKVGRGHGYYRDGVWIGIR